MSLVFGLRGQLDENVQHEFIFDSL